MSRQRLTMDVIKYLQDRNYRYLRFLGAGGYGDIISVINPNGREVAVKIIQRQDIWPIEDKYWPRLRHPHILQVFEVIKIKELKVKLYITPVLPRTLDEIVESKEFRKDPKSYERLMKWAFQTLLAIEFLHKKGMAHLDIKSDNVLIDNNDDAVLADFTGLNFTTNPVQRLISPDEFQPPECFDPDGKKNVRGECFDVWAYGLMLLNLMTGHYFAKKAASRTSFTDWSTHLSPILQKSLKTSKFVKLVKNSLPKSNLSSSDMNLARHFIQFTLNLNPDDRPRASRLKRHLLMKTITNPFMKETWHRTPKEKNPFIKAQSEQDRNDRGDAASNMEGQNYSSGPSQGKGTSRRKNNLKQWFMKQFNRIF